MPCLVCDGGDSRSTHTHTARRSVASLSGRDSHAQSVPGLYLEWRRKLSQALDVADVVSLGVGVCVCV